MCVYGPPPHHQLVSVSVPHTSRTTCNHLNLLRLLLLFVFAMPFAGEIFLDCLAPSSLLVFRLCVVIFLPQFPHPFTIFHGFSLFRIYFLLCFLFSWQTVILTFHAHLFVMLLWPAALTARERSTFPFILFFFFCIYKCVRPCIHRNRSGP